jgi:hypothetical protein
LTAGNQRDAPEVVPLGDHLGADQHVDVPGMHRAELRFQRPLQARRIGIDARDARRRTVRGAQQVGQLLLEALGATPDRRDIEVAAVGAGARHPLGVAAVVAAQRTVQLVKHAPGAAMRAPALPTALAAMQHRAHSRGDSGTRGSARRARCAAAAPPTSGGASAMVTPLALGSWFMSSNRTCGSAPPPIRVGSPRRW